jgi:hypothetical protein
MHIRFRDFRANTHATHLAPGVAGGRGGGEPGYAPRHDQGFEADGGGSDDDGAYDAGSAQAQSQGSASDLSSVLRRIDGKGYKAYNDIQGAWSFDRFTLYCDWIQGDPFAAPSRCRVLVPALVARIPPELWATKTRATALCDFLTRSFGQAVAASGGTGVGVAGGVGGVGSRAPHFVTMPLCMLSRWNSIPSRLRPSQRCFLHCRLCGDALRRHGGPEGDPKHACTALRCAALRCAALR